MGYKMVMVKVSLMLFGGDMLVVWCLECCYIYLMSVKVLGDSYVDILSVQDWDSVYLMVFYSGIWNVFIDSYSQLLEYFISYVLV